MTQQRRRQIIINKLLQKRIVFAAAWAPSLCLAGASLLIGVFCVRLYQEALDARIFLPSVVYMFMVSVGFMVVATAYMMFAALKLSHRIAGPIFNFKRTLRRVQDGEIHARVLLREQDYLMEIQDDINSFLDWLQKHPPADYTVVPPREVLAAGDSESETSANAEADADSSAEADAQDTEPEKATADS